MISVSIIRMGETETRLNPEVWNPDQIEMLFGIGFNIDGNAVSRKSGNLLLEKVSFDGNRWFYESRVGSQLPHEVSWNGFLHLLAFLQKD